MLQDRPYMHSSYERRRTSVLTWLVSAIAAVFVIQSLAARVSGTGMGLEHAFALTPFGIKAGRAWTLLTYGFLHDTSNLLQVIVYLPALYFLGREVLPILGARRFLALFAGALVSGGLSWTALHWGRPASLIGASPAVAALIVVFACFYPNREITTLLFFLPISFKPKNLAFLVLAIDLAGLAFYEVMGAASPLGTAAPSAHLGGMAAGWIYFRYFHDAGWPVARSRADAALPRWLKEGNSPEAVGSPTASNAAGAGSGQFRAEVDRILDKINSDGFGSLTAAERKVLDSARDLIGRR